LVLLGGSLLILCAGARDLLVEYSSKDVVIPLAENRAYAKKEAGNAYIVDLSRFDLTRYADSDRYPFRSRLVLTEDGLALQPHANHSEIRSGFGKFSHWNYVLYFSTTDGSDPFENGKNYVLAGKIPKSSVARLLQYLDAIALIGLAALSFFATTVKPPGTFRIGVVLLGTSLAGSFALQLYPTASRFGITPDSESYTWNADNPVRAVRPPGYAVFMDATSDVRHVGQNIGALARQGKANQVLTDGSAEPLRKVIVAQKAALALALVAAFLGLCTFLPLPLAAAVTLGVGCFIEKSGIPWIAARPFWDVATAVLISLSVLVATWRRDTLWRAMAIATGLVITLYPVFRMLVHVPMVPANMDFIMSETLTMAAQLLLVACLCCFLYTRRTVWLYLASLAFALSIWMRQAAIFELGMVLLALLAALSFRPRPSIAALAGVAVVSIAFMQAPALYHRAILGAKDDSPPTMSWSLACFALEVARPDDVKLMPDATAVRFFNEALAERQKRLAQHDAGSGPSWSRLGLNMYLVALPVAERIVGSHAMSPAVSDLLFAFAVPVYKARAVELVEIWWESFRHAIGDGTRLSEGQPLWWTLIGVALLAVLVRRPAVLAGCILLLGHFGHMLVVSVFDAPISRYVHATEFLVVIGITLIAMGAIEELAATLRATFPLRRRFGDAAP
jgi:hypothetical protein